MTMISGVGNVGSSEFKVLPSGKGLLTLSINLDGGWHTAKIFDNQVPSGELEYAKNTASVLHSSIGKGTMVSIEGSVRTETWKANTGFGGAAKEMSKQVIHPSRIRVLAQAGEIPLAHAMRDHRNVPEVAAALGWLQANVQDFKLPVYWDYVSAEVGTEEPVAEPQGEEELPF